MRPQGGVLIPNGLNSAVTQYGGIWHFFSDLCEPRLAENRNESCIGVEKDIVPEPESFPPKVENVAELCPKFGRNAAALQRQCA